MPQPVVYCEDVNNVEFASRESHIRAHAMFNQQLTTGISVEAIPSFIVGEEEIEEDFYTTKFPILESSGQEPTADDIARYINSFTKLDTEFPLEISFDRYFTEKINYYVKYVMDLDIQMDSSFTDILDLYQMPKIISNPAFKKLNKYLTTLININFNNRDKLNQLLKESKENKNGLIQYAIPLLDIIPTACPGGANWYKFRNDFIKVNKQNNIIPEYDVVADIFKRIVSVNPYIQDAGYFVFCYSLKGMPNASLMNSAVVICRMNGKFLINPIFD